MHPLAHKISVDKSLVKITRQEAKRFRISPLMPMTAYDFPQPSIVSYHTENYFCDGDLNFRNNL